MNDEQALNPIKLPPPDLMQWLPGGVTNYFTESTLTAAIHRDRDEQAAKWEAAMRADREETIRQMRAREDCRESSPQVKTAEN